MKKHKKWIIVAVILIVAAGTGLFFYFRDFDAKGYTQAVLDHMFQGETKEAASIMKNVTEEELEEQYEKQVAAFVENNITGGIEVSDSDRARFENLTKEIFAVMRYEVTKEDKISRNEYEVSVEIQPTDIFPVFVAGVKQDSQELMNKAEAGEYSGSEEEINQQMQRDYINHSYELLESAYSRVEYGNKETVILKVKAGKDRAFSISEEELNDLILKILRLDEIQD